MCQTGLQGARFSRSLAGILAVLGLFCSAASYARVIHVSPTSDAGAPASPARLLEPRAGIADSARVGDILYVLKVSNDAFVFGDVVRIEYHVTNEGTEPFTFHFMTDCLNWFFIYPDTCGPNTPGCVTSWDNNWPWCEQIATPLTIQPGETEVFREDWRELTNEGYRTPSGRYTIWGALRDSYFDESLLSLRIQIVPYGPEPIQEALDAAGPGDEVVVAPGTYHENLDLLNRHNGVILRSERGPEVTVLDGGGRGSAIYAYQVFSATTIQGFTIRNGSEGGGGGIAVLRASPTIRGNIIRDNLAVNGGGIYCSPASTPLIEDNLFLGNRASTNGGALYIDVRNYGTGWNISNNTFAGNYALNGAGVYDSYGYGQVPSLRWNIFYANYAATSGGGLRCGGGVQISHMCNAWWQNIPNDMAGCSNENHAVFADPLFCNPVLVDYHLQAASPCAPANSSYCGLIGAYDVGCLVSDVTQDGTVPAGGGRAWRVVPNPSSGVVSFTRVPGGHDPFRVDVFNASGRAVRSLTAPAGASSVLWDGLDREGRGAPAGVYFARMGPAGGSGPASARVMFVRIAGR